MKEAGPENRDSGVGAFLDACRTALGGENVIAGGEALEKLSRDPVYSCRPPVGAVYPGDGGEVSAVVRAASEHGVAVWVYSTALNWGYCNTAGEEGCVVMILKRMNRILEVDEELGFVVLEPGVTYAQLNDYLRDRGISLWTDCTGGPPGGSVLGNALDRGFGVTPYGDHFAQLCGLEVVMADGSTLRTGGFSEGEDRTGHTFPRPAGPLLAGLFSQSNFGIVVRAGLWLMAEPEHFEVASLRLSGPGELPGALDAMRELMLRGDMPEKGRFSNDVATLTLLTQAGSGSPGFLSDEERARLRQAHGIAEWTGAYGLYGSRPLVRAMKGLTARKFRRFGRLSFLSLRTVELMEKVLDRVRSAPEGPLARTIDLIIRRFVGCSVDAASLIPDFMRIHQGIPNESVVRRAYFRHPEKRPHRDIDVARDGIGLMWFVPLLPFRGREIVDYVDSCRAIFHRHGFDHSVSITPVNARTVVPLMVILYDRRDGKSCERAAALYGELQEDALEKGYQQFRCGHPGWERFLAGNPALREWLGGIKNALDPKGILAPGRYGIR